MASIWIAAENRALARTLAHHVEQLGVVALGEPERAAFKPAAAPDLLILCGVGEPAGVHAALERLLAFVRQIALPRRAPAPVLYVAAGGGPAPAEIARLFDDRRADVLEFPFDPEELVARARALVAASAPPPSLRERARQVWVAGEVERLYASLDLPALRQAVDPRNAHRPVLLLGEPGTRRGLLARYVHNLAEPPREALITLALDEVPPGELEREIAARSAGQRVSVLVERVERAPAARQDELAHLLGESGALALEPLRWLVSATRAAALSRSLRALPWLRVELPPLRERPDAAAVVDAVLRAVAQRQGRELELDPEARAELLEYAWPGNLRELEQVLDASCASARGPAIRVEELAFAGRIPARAAEIEIAPEPEAGIAAEPEPVVEPEPVLGVEPEAEVEPVAAEPVVEAEPEPEPAELVSDEDLMLATVEAEPEPIELTEVVEEEVEAPAEPAPVEVSPQALLLPLARALRAPLRAVRTYAGLVGQRPDDATLRRELAELVERDLGSLDETLQKLERFARFAAPAPHAFSLAAALGAELDARQAAARAKTLVVLRELDAQAPPCIADETQVRFAIGALLDLAMRLAPAGGDLYLGSAWHPRRDDQPAGHRILLRFHSPEDVLAGPLDEEDGGFLEVALARDLFTRAGARFAVDTSGAQDNLVLVELPG